MKITVEELLEHVLGEEWEACYNSTECDKFPLDAQLSIVQCADVRAGKVDTIGAVIFALNDDAALMIRERVRQPKLIGLTAPKVSDG